MSGIISKSIIKSLFIEMILPFKVKRINKILEVMRVRVSKRKTILIHN